MKPFVITPQNKPYAIELINKLDPTKQWQMSITEKKSKRSLEQNKWMRGFAKDAGDYFGYDADRFYEMLMFKFCPEYIVNLDTGEEVRKPGHFSKKQDGTPRTTGEAAEIQDAVQRWAAEFGFVWEEVA
jgi:hypothetical protein